MMGVLVFGIIASALVCIPVKDRLPIGLEPEVMATRTQRVTRATLELGKYLFFDPSFSRSGEVSCASCHLPEHSFADPRKLSLGAGGRKTQRNSPAIINRIYGRSQFWDGRASSLEDQVRGPLFDPNEMAGSEDAVMQALNGERYTRMFREAFGGTPTLPRMAEAIAAFERSIVSGNSPFDRHEWGGGDPEFGEDEKAGLVLFRGKARCSICHSGFNFTDEAFHNIGAGDNPDPGLMRVTERNEDFGKFKTPSLRNVAVTPPYMHDGSIATIAEVIIFYNEGGRKSVYLDPEIRPLGLDTDEIRQLASFLKALTGPVEFLSERAFTE